MSDVIVIGDGPGGLSAALLLAKNQQDVVVFGDDKSAMHYAQLRNYLDRRDQWVRLPADRPRAGQRCRRTPPRGARERGRRPSGEHFTVTPESGEQVTAKYLILSRKAPGS